MSKEYPEVINRRINNTMTKRKRTKEQTTIFLILYRKLKIKHVERH